MKIRSITYTLDLNKVGNLEYDKKVQQQIEIIRKEFDEGNVEIRTVRFNTLLLELKDEMFFEDYGQKLIKVRHLALSCDVRWFNLPLDIWGCPKGVFQANCKTILLLIREFRELFVNVLIPSHASKDISKTKALVELMRDISKISSNGYDSFRFGISCNPVVNTPFFPYSFGNSDNGFSIALESVNPILNSIKSFKSDNRVFSNVDLLDAIKEDLIQHFCVLDAIIDKTSLKQFFTGFDASLAPFPDENISVLDVLEEFGLEEFGSYGTVYVTESLTRMLKAALLESGVISTGFNGVMYSLLEDKRLCASNDNDRFDINSLMLYSTVCGCGLDMIPIPGEFIVEEVASLILDVSSLAVKHDKPLGIRLLPIPFKWYGDRTEFNMDFLADTKLMSLNNTSLNI